MPHLYAIALFVTQNRLLLHAKKRETDSPKSLFADLKIYK